MGFDEGSGVGPGIGTFVGAGIGVGVGARLIVGFGVGVSSNFLLTSLPYIVLSSPIIRRININGG
jgi:hypothetical protein